MTCDFCESDLELSVCRRVASVKYGGMPLKELMSTYASLRGFVSSDSRARARAFAVRIIMRVSRRYALYELRVTGIKEFPSVCIFFNYRFGHEFLFVPETSDYEHSACCVSCAHV